MSVHVGEVHTDIVPSPTSQPPPDRTESRRLGAAEEAWAGLRRIAHRDACRTAATGFDD